MKNLSLKIFALILLAVQISQAAPEATYYRVFQGFKKPSLSSAQFLNILPDFMNATTSLYGDVLNEYHVAIPPQNKPSFIPDEFALVSLSSEAEYRAMRATPEGQNYSAAHWDVFDKDTSKSLPLEPGIPNVLVSQTAYNVIGEPNDWSSGATLFYVGTRKSHIRKTDFLEKLSQHILQVEMAFKPYGLKGYIVIADENYEVAYMNWTSYEDMEYALLAPEGKRILRTADSMMDTLQWNGESAFQGNSVMQNRFYRTK